MKVDIWALYMSLHIWVKPKAFFLGTDIHSSSNSCCIDKSEICVNFAPFSYILIWHWGIGNQQIIQYKKIVNEYEIRIDLKVSFCLKRILRQPSRKCITWEILVFSSSPRACMISSLKSLASNYSHQPTTCKLAPFLTLETTSNILN